MNKTLSNVIASVALQLVTIVCGFITPRLILGTFGSDVNGLLNSISQFLSYVTLFEGGLNAVILAELYGPVHGGDQRRVSAIIAAANRFYQRLAIFFVLYTLGLGIFYPFLVKTPYDFAYICSLTLILSISLFSQYCFAIAYRALLKAMEKVVFLSLVQIGVVVGNTLLTVLAIAIFPNVHAVKLISSLVFVAQPLLYRLYLRHNASLEKGVEADSGALSQRWSGFGINMAAFIHDNTDIVLLTLLATLSDVSIYSVYFLVVTGLKRLIQSLSAGIVPTLGRRYVAGDEGALQAYFSRYEFIIFFFTFLLFTVGAFTITPFVAVYTKGIDDANYRQQMLGILLILAEGIFCLREPYVNMAYTANRFRQIQKYAYMEAVINIVLSVILVYRLGLIGVAIGTLVGMSYRTIRQVVYLGKHILHRSYRPVLVKLGVFSLGVLLTTFISMSFFRMADVSWMGWILYAFWHFLLVLSVNILLCWIFFRGEIKVLWANIFK